MTWRQRGAKRQPGGRIDQVRHRAADRLQADLVLAVEVDARNGADQALRIGMVRVLEQPVDGGLLDHLAGIHHHHALRGFRHHAHGMGDQHHRHAEALLHVLQQIEDLRLDGDVERGGGLVGDHQLGLAGQRHRDHDALAHAAGELVRIVVHAACALGICTSFSISTARASAALSVRPLAAQAFGDLLADGQHRIERGHRLLEDEADLVGADLVQLVAGERYEVAALEQDLGLRRCGPAAWRSAAGSTSP